VVARGAVFNPMYSSIHVPRLPPGHVRKPSERAAGSYCWRPTSVDLAGIVAVAPSWMSEEILSASQQIDEGRPAVWLSKN
jgi:hypothetical protein